MRSRMRANRPGRGQHGAEPTAGGPGGVQQELPGGGSPQPAQHSPAPAPTTTMLIPTAAMYLSKRKPPP